MSTLTTRGELSVAQAQELLELEEKNKTLEKKHKNELREKDEYIDILECVIFTLIHSMNETDDYFAMQNARKLAEFILKRK